MARGLDRGLGGYQYSSVVTTFQPSTPSWKPWSAMVTTGEPGYATSVALPGSRASAVNDERFDHVRSSGYARVRPALTAADIHAELDAAV